MFSSLCVLYRSWLDISVTEATKKAAAANLPLYRTVTLSYISFCFIWKIGILFGVPVHFWHILWKGRIHFCNFWIVSNLDINICNLKFEKIIQGNIFKEPSILLIYKHTPSSWKRVERAREEAQTEKNERKEQRQSDDGSEKLSLEAELCGPSYSGILLQSTFFMIAHTRNCPHQLGLHDWQVMGYEIRTLKIILLKLVWFFLSETICFDKKKTIFS